MDDRADDTGTQTTWGSLDDDVLLSFVNKLDSHNQLRKETSKNHENEPVTDVDTDVDTDKDENNKNKDDDIYASIKTSEWSSMNDSKFINYVNKLTQSRQFDTTMELQNTSKVSNNGGNYNPLLSSPIILAQNIAEEEEEDVEEEKGDEDEENLSDEQPVEEFNNYEDYFAEKNRKQNLQGEELKKFLQENDDSGNEYPPIFKNCAIHVNGRTDPDILQLRKLILLYGGRYVHYLSSKGSVTHIVAESLPPRKRIQFGNCKVVSPKWIMESIEAKKLQDYSLYRIEKLNDYGQQIIEFPKHKEVDEKKEEVEEEKIEEVEYNNEDNEKDDQLSQELQRSGIDATHPDFLKIFFSKSRLHHLSTWKSELRSKFMGEAITALQEKRKTTDFETPQKVIMHVDFDCFFATVSAMKQNPQIDINKVPCCVTHGGKSADIASCNYVARQYGVSNGMWMSNAQKLCPNIVSLPYYFEDYENISKKFYEKLLSMDINTILPVSIDEALVDISYLCHKEQETNGKSILDVIQEIKNELDSITNCTLSCGTGRNVLLAKLALRKAKPNGVYSISNNEDEINKFLKDVDVKQLPGFGRKLIEKLNTFFPDKANITVSEIKTLDKLQLTNTFGSKIGAKLYEYARGNDDTSIDILEDFDKYARKSVNIDVNWGIRFTTDPDIETFLSRLAVELGKRLLNINMKGSSITLKLSIRHPDAPIEPSKYMGMGQCTFTSKTAKLGVMTRDSGVLAAELKYLWRFLNVEPKELRGVGVCMNKLSSDELKVDNKQMKLNFNVNANTDRWSMDDVKLLPKKTSQNRNVSPTKKSPSRNHSPVVDDLDAEIDWNVFDCLPFDLQMEIKNELRRRKLQTSPKKRKVFANDQDIAYLLSPKKKKPKVDADCKEPISPEKLKERREKNIVFQGISVSDESKLLRKLIAWMDYTLIGDNEINENDMELFRDFMIKILSSHNTLKFIRIYQILNRRLMLSNDVNSRQFITWDNELKSLNHLVNEQKLSTLEFDF